MKRLALTAIETYRRYISPYKGFGCAYRTHTGHASCSSIGSRAIRRFGVMLGLKVLRRRLYLCGVAHRRFGSGARRAAIRQRGSCDVPCDLPCDGIGSGSKCFSSAGDLGNCCDWPERKRKKQNPKEKHVYLPPDARARAHASQQQPNASSSGRESA